MTIDIGLQRPARTIHQSRRLVTRTLKTSDRTCFPSVAHGATDFFRLGQPATGKIERYTLRAPAKMDSPGGAHLSGRGRAAQSESNEGVFTNAEKVVVSAQS